MARGMSKEARKELVAAIALRYREASRLEKTQILDEFVQVTGYHRKHALRVLRRGAGTMRRPKATIRTKVYDQAVTEALVIVWEAADRICSKRLKAALPR